MTATEHPDEHILHPTECPEWHVWAIRLSQIIARAWTDDAFRARLVADPAAVLDEFGLAVPAGMSVVVREGATNWSLSGSALTGAGLFELPLPPKPDVDQIVRAWAEGEAGHPPVLSGAGAVAFQGVPAGANPAEARRVADARDAAEGRRLTELRRLTEARRLTADAEAGVGRRLTENRRLAEGRRLVDDSDPAGDAAGRRLAEARRLVDPPEPSKADGGGKKGRARAGKSGPKSK